MDFCPNAPNSLPQEHIFTTNFTQTEQGEEEEEGEAPENGGLSQLLSHQPIEGDENSEWLSVFVEDCLSSSGNYLLAPANQEIQMITKQSSAPNPVETLKPQQVRNPNPENPTKKARKKKPRSMMKLKTQKIPSSIFDLQYLVSELHPDPDPDTDPPLLHQAHWLADSEPIFLIKKETCVANDEKLRDVAVKLSLSSKHYNELEKTKKKVSKPRRCSHCQAEKTPLWRQGPLGKGTLCNACGVRWLKSGKLFPEYRPANSPTFVSDLHSNVLRKVLKMREARQSSSSSGSWSSSISP